MRTIEFNEYGQPIQPGTSVDGLMVAVFVVFIALALLGRFMPTIIAFLRRHPQRWNIFGLNFFVGVNGWGWTALMARSWEVI